MLVALVHLLELWSLAVSHTINPPPQIPLCCWLQLESEVSLYVGHHRAH